MVTFTAKFIHILVNIDLDEIIRSQFDNTAKQVNIYILLKAVWSYLPFFWSFQHVVRKVHEESI